MFVIIEGLEGVKQVISNASGLDIKFARNTVGVEFTDAQGIHDMFFALDTIETITWSRTVPVGVQEYNRNAVTTVV